MSTDSAIPSDLIIWWFYIFINFDFKYGIVCSGQQLVVQFVLVVGGFTHTYTLTCTHARKNEC